MSNAIEDLRDVGDRVRLAAERLDTTRRLVAALMRDANTLSTLAEAQRAGLIDVEQEMAQSYDDLNKALDELTKATQDEMQEIDLQAQKIADLNTQLAQQANVPVSDDMSAAVARIKDLTSTVRAKLDAVNSTAAAVGSNAPGGTASTAIGATGPTGGAAVGAPVAGVDVPLAGVPATPGGAPATGSGAAVPSTDSQPTPNSPNQDSSAPRTDAENTDAGLASSTTNGAPASPGTGEASGATGGTDVGVPPQGADTGASGPSGPSGATGDDSATGDGATGATRRGRGATA